MNGEFFTSYLHENYLDFYTSIDDVVKASEYLSDADYVIRDWAVCSSCSNVLFIQFLWLVRMSAL